MTLAIVGTVSHIIRDILAQREGISDWGLRKAG